MKINCDTNFSIHDGRAVVAVILRDDQGKLVDGVVSTVYSFLVRQGEAHDIRLAYLFLQSLGLSNIQVESDNKEVIALCISKLVPPWDCSAIIHDIQVLKLTLHASFAWIPREANGVSHKLARAHLHGVLPFEWVVNPPVALSKLLSVDVPL